MKKKSLVCALAVFMLTGIVACTTPNAQTDNANMTESAQEDEAAAKAEEEKKAQEEAAKAEEEKKAKEAAAKKAEEEKKAKEEAAKKAEEERIAAEEKAKEEELKNGIDEAVDFSKVTLFDEEKTMYVQRGVNVRTGPEKKYDKVDYLNINTKVQVLGQYEKDGWYFVVNKDKKAFICNSFLGDKEVDLEALKAQQEAEAALAAQRQAEAQAAAQQQQAQQPAQQQQAQAAPAPVAVQAPAGILFIGDSRCVQMREAVGGGNSSWICEGGKGYDWFSTTGLAQADPIIGKGTKVVICMGVNDTDHASMYANLVNAKAAEWAARGAKTYYVSVNPVWTNPWVTEEQVMLFNSTIIGQLSGVRWIDTHSYLANTGYVLVDGLHYDTNTYINIFNVIVGSLR